MDQKKTLTSPQMKAGELRVFDVRSHTEISLSGGPLKQGTHTADNLELTQIQSGALHLNAEDFKKKFGFEKPKETDKIAFSCKGGIRSAVAANEAVKAGFKDVYDNVEGTNAKYFNDN